MVPMGPIRGKVAGPICEDRMSLSAWGLGGVDFVA